VMRTTNDRLGNMPDGHFDDGAIREFRSVIKRALCLIAYCAMNDLWRQTTYMEAATYI
jgi:hypothetical protein